MGVGCQASLDLGGTHLGEPGVRSICDDLSAGLRLESLDLSRCSVGRDAAAELCTTLCNLREQGGEWALRTLQLSRNALGAPTPAAAAAAPRCRYCLPLPSASVSARLLTRLPSASAMLFACPLARTPTDGGVYHPSATPIYACLPRHDASAQALHA